jgi:TRAP-type transport system small permease protein
MIALLKSLDKALGFALRWFCIANMLALTLVLTAVVFIRFVPVATLSWSDEIVEWLMASLIFIAAAALWRENDHFKITMISERLAGTQGGRVFTLVLEVLTAIFIALFAQYSLDLTLGVGRTSPVLSWPVTWWYAPMPIAGFIMVVYAIRNVVQGIRAVVEGCRRNRADGLAGVQHEQRNW